LCLMVTIKVTIYGTGLLFLFVYTLSDMFMNEKIQKYV
jgi:hypothetical protein